MSLSVDEPWIAAWSRSTVFPKPYLHCCHSPSCHMCVHQCFCLSSGSMEALAQLKSNCLLLARVCVDIVMVTVVIASFSAAWFPPLWKRRKKHPDSSWLRLFTLLPLCVCVCMCEGGVCVCVSERDNVGLGYKYQMCQYSKEHITIGGWLHWNHEVKWPLSQRETVLLVSAILTNTARCRVCVLNRFDWLCISQLDSPTLHSFLVTFL